MTRPLALQRVSTVDAIASALRTRIMDGDLAAGERLRELELAEAYGVARHSLRAALRELSAEGLVTIEPNRGARVAQLTAADLGPLFELRTALELEAARLALARHDGRLPKRVHDAVRLMGAACAQEHPPWSAVVEAHDRVHSAIVAAAGSPRIERAYAALAGEMRLFVIQLQPSWPLERMAEHHERLLADLERDGPEPLRAHLDDGRASILSG
jgi:DNA-binding GntR family transcriptional regulator